MKTEHVYRPVAFFTLTLSLTWVTWFGAAFLSYQTGTEALQTLLMLLGLCAPLAAAVILMQGQRNRELRREFWDRLLNLRRVKPIYLPVIVLLMPVTVLIATALSLTLGQPASQFNLASQFSFSAGLAPVLLVLILAPALEELGWRGYGVDSLRSKLGLLPATLLFAGLWAAWHLPLYFVNHYYQNDLWNTNLLFAANFIVSVLPAAIIMNWLYDKNNRSIAACILFHFTLDAASEMFQTQQVTKVIVTLILLAIALVLMVKDPEFSTGHEMRQGQRKKSVESATTA
jgi:membrane protease YdiL (CAAX protease family)